MTFPPNLAQDVPVQNRGKDTISDSPISITLMNIDETIINYISDVIRPQIKINDEVLMVNVFYATPERWATIQKDGFIRDPRTDKAQTPAISIRRTGVSRGTLNNPVNKYLYRTFTHEWNKKTAYDRFAVLNNIIPSKKITQTIVPDYVRLGYEVTLWTEFQEQLNSLIEQINVENDEYWGKQNAFKFRVKIDDYSDSTELPTSDVRMVRASFNMNVEAYLLPQQLVRNYSPGQATTTEYTAKKVVAFVETTGSIE